MREKVTVFGAGNVGATVAHRLALKDIADIVLLDVIEGLAEGRALDIAECFAIEGISSSITGGMDSSLSEGSDVVVVTAGVARKPGMSREDLLEKNAGIVRSVGEVIRGECPEAIVLAVTNPLDAMAYLLYRTIGTDKRRVMGMAGVLDSARFATFIAMELAVPAESVRTMVLGSHGDSMVAIPSLTSVNGIPLTALLDSEHIERLVERTRNAGAEIVSLLRTGSACYAPASAVVRMVEAILKDTKEILPASVLLEGEYGIDGVFTGVPVVVGRGGWERVIEVELSAVELRALQLSASAVEETVLKLEVQGLC